MTEADRTKPAPGDPADEPAGDDRRDERPDDEVDLLLVTMTFDAAEPDELLALLSKYVVLSRGHRGCRNIDLVASATVPGRFLIVQKWDSPDSQRAHFDSPEMVDMAKGCTGLLRSPPTIDLYEPISAHDLY